MKLLAFKIHLVCSCRIWLQKWQAVSSVWLFVFLCVQAGHPFQQRCVQSAFSNGKPKNEAPVFLLFLDCVWQILRQFPCSFQFNEHFLVTLFEHAYASQFGTFLGNSAAERSVIHFHSPTLTFADESDLWNMKRGVFEIHSITEI